MSNLCENSRFLKKTEVPVNDFSVDIVIIHYIFSTHYFLII